MTFNADLIVWTQRKTTLLDIRDRWTVGRTNRTAELPREAPQARERAQAAWERI